MTYTINGTQYWKRNGVYCSWTKDGGRKVITESEYRYALDNKDIVNTVVETIDPKSKVEISYQEIGKSGKILNKRKVVTQANLDKVIANMETKDSFYKILATRVV